MLILYIKRIDLKNFRNYKEFDIELGKGVNIFYGQNAQGKTNIIESIYMEVFHFLCFYHINEATKKN